MFQSLETVVVMVVVRAGFLMVIYLRPYTFSLAKRQWPLANFKQLEIDDKSLLLTFFSEKK